MLRRNVSSLQNKLTDLSVFGIGNINICFPSVTILCCNVLLAGYFDFLSVGLGFYV